MLIYLRILIFFFLVFLPFSFAYGAEKRIVAIAYHDVVEKKDQLVSDGVTLDTLINHFEWLLVSGYQPVSIADLIAARAGKKTLPDKPVLLCWDDGYKSFYTHVLPLLKAYNFPAVLALVGEWMSAGKDETVLYGSTYVSREKFLSWQEVMEVHKSGLVEIASHSMNLHRALLADTSGDMLPAAITHAFNPETLQYETEFDYSERIRVDLERNSQLIARHLGERPRVMVWPFGRYNEFTLKIAHDVGMEVTLTLDPVSGSLENLAALGRVYPTLNPETGMLRADLKEKQSTPLRRFMRVKMSDLIEEDLQSELQFSKLLERIHSLQVGSVVFEPILEIDGEIHALFANSYLPVAQDRLLRLLWQTDRRGGAESILWLSTTLFDIEKQNHRSEISGTSPSPPSLFSDLGKAAPCSGVIINDQSFAKSLFASVGMLSQTYGEKTYGADIFKKRYLRKAWRLAGELPDYSLEILENIEKIQAWQPFIEVALLVTPEMLAEASAGQIAAALSGFDYLVLDLADEQTIPDNTAAFRPYLVPMLKYESTNRNGEKILAQQFDQLTREGFINHAYTDDHFLDNSPSPAVIRETISISTYPVRPR
jgi:biofilm PGA synthesis lipoprotein PgaB